MRKVVVSELLTLDGVMASPEIWSFPFWNEEIARFKMDEISDSGALLLGRITYEGLSKAWPDSTEKYGFAGRINAMPKYVVSTTLENAAWINSSLIKEQIPEKITQLKAQPGQDILINGSAMLVQTLMQHCLVDEFRLLIFPVVVGSGKRLFQEGCEAGLKLLQSKMFSSGVVLMTYQAR